MRAERGEPITYVSRRSRTRSTRVPIAAGTEAHYTLVNTDRTAEMRIPMPIADTGAAASAALASDAPRRAACVRPHIDKNPSAKFHFHKGEVRGGTRGREGR